MRPTPNEYKKMSEKASPAGKHLSRFVCAYIVGGTICAFGQLLLGFYKSIGMPESSAYTMVSITLIMFSALCTGLKIYDNIARYAGAGTLVPITGFANAVCSPALEFKSEGYVLGLGAKMFVIAGPVIVYGTLASVVYGVIYFVLNNL